MKKLFTLIAFLTVIMGAKAAEWVEDYRIDYSTYTGFPFFVMGYVPEWIDGVMTDMGGAYSFTAVDEAEETSDVIVTTQGGVQYYRFDNPEGSWHQYFIADGIPTELDGQYTVKAMVRASEECTVSVNMGWGWGSGELVSSSFTAGTEWAEVEWDYSGIGGTSCNLVAQPNTTAKIEWKYLVVGHMQREQRPIQWQEWLTSDGKSALIETTPAAIPTYMGNAEFGQWPSWSFETSEGVNINWRGDRTGEICAWSLTMGRNNDSGVYDGKELDGRARPYPADIEAEAGNESNHVFAVHVDQIGKIDDDASIQWSNQFWIQSPQSWKEGTQVKIKFRYKAQKAAKAATQIHKEHPSDYLHYDAIGDVNFTTEWQDFEKIVTISGSQAGGWSIAFNLCAESTVENPQESNVFYFDDLSWQTMKLDEGLFVASSNTATGIQYDFDNAIPFEYDEEMMAYMATVGEKGKQDSWVNELMISTTRGNDQAFKAATLKPSGDFIGEDNWGNYTESSLAKIKLPAAGVWSIAIDTENKQINIIKLEGEEDKVPITINPNPTVVVVNGQERDWTEAESEQMGLPEKGKGAAWDNQFFIVANRVIEAGEETVISFDYMSSVEAKTTTQCHGEPGAYIHYGAIGDVQFTTEWQSFEKTFTIPSECAGKGMKSIAFNMAEIKEACVYQIKNVVWKLSDGSESLINQEGAENFYVKEGAGTDPYVFGTDPQGISSVVSKNSASGVTYNLAGQRVSKDYKGIVVKNGRKNIAK